MSCKNITQVNEGLKNVNKNLNELEELFKNGSNVSAEHVRELQEETNKLLHDLESASSKKILKIAKIRQKRRQRRKKKRELAKQENETHALISLAAPQRNAKPFKTNALPLQKRADAQRFLQIFGLLERLYKTRSQNTTDKSQFANKFSTLRRIWLDELWSSKSLKTDHKSLSSQWEEVLFGDNKPTKRQTMKEFLRIRHTWDSYISKSKSASCIPNGWVMPQASEKWQKYLAQ